MTPTKIDDSQRVVPVEATDLLPCPMCTSAAEFHAIPVTEDSADENAGGVYVECSNPRCGVCTQLRFPLMEDVRPLLAETWNRRTAAPSAEPPVCELEIALGMLADWCVAIEVNGTGWDDWDEHYKDASYRPGPLREKLDAAIAEARTRRAAQ